MITKCSTRPQTNDRFDEWERMYSSDNDEENQSYSPHTQIDDDWEEMYLGGMFIVSINHYTLHAGGTFYDNLIFLRMPKRITRNLILIST